MSLYDAYATDQKAESDGQWVEFRDGVQVRVRSDECAKSREWATRRAKKNRQILVANGGVLPPHISDKNEIDHLAEVLVVGWRGVTDASGMALECTTENIRKVMTDLPAFRRDVLYAARTEETFRDAAEVAAMGKTSATPSEPSSPSEGTPSA